MYMKYFIIALCTDVLSYVYYWIMQRCSIFLYGSLDECVEYYWCVCFLGSCFIYNLRCSCRKWMYSVFSCVEFFSINLALIGTWNFTVTWNFSLYIEGTWLCLKEYVELEHFNIHTAQYSGRPTHIKHTTSLHNAIIRIRHYISTHCNNEVLYAHLREEAHDKWLTVLSPQNKFCFICIILSYSLM
jgi:hypothetical protein